MAIESPRPDVDKLSTLAALVLLAYSLVRIVRLPPVSTELSLFGILIPISLNTRMVMLALAAALTVIGIDWLIRSHPNCDQERRTTEHWVLPALACVGIGSLLTRIPEGPFLWIGLILAAGVLIAVLVAEFYVVDPADPRHSTWALGLRALAYVLLLEIFFAARATGLRAVYAIPLIFASSTGVAWRLLRLRRPAEPHAVYAGILGWAIAQLAWGLHYWPILPLREALLLVLLQYALTGALQTALAADLDRRRLVEYLLVTATGVGAVLALT